MSNAIPFIPEGYHTVTTSLTIKGAAEALEFYKKAFGATEDYRLENPDGTIVHAEFRIGDSVIMLSDEFPEWGSLSPQTVGGCPITLIVYVPDVDAAIAKAIEAGAKELTPICDQFWGDRMGCVTDPYGFKWTFGTHQENLSIEEIKKRFKDWVSGNATAAKKD